MSSRAPVNGFFHRLPIALTGFARIALGVIAFLIGFLTAAAGAFIMIFQAGSAVNHYLATALAPNLVELVGSAVAGAWLGAVILCVGLAFLWISRKLDPNGAVRSDKAYARKRRSKR